MNYLYGDSTSSPLKSNFLEFLRDAIDFSVFALQADERIKEGKEQLVAARADAEKDLQRLERFVAAVSRTIDEEELGASDSAASYCAARLTALVAETHRTTAADVAQRLAQRTAQIEAAEATARTTCTTALATMLRPHELHDATIDVRLTLRTGGTYKAELTGCAPFGLEWTFALDVPDGSPWRGPVRIDSVVQHLEVHAPQLTGWLSKEVKVRPQNLDRHVVTEFVDDGEKVALKLRPEPSVESGFDVVVDHWNNRVKMTRVGPADDASVGPFDVRSDDAPALVALAEKLRASSAQLQRGALVGATFDGQAFQTLPVFAEVVKRFVATTAPIVCEISQRSLTPNELVLRRGLANNRREEIYVPKVTLREKYGVLPKPLAALFAPLRLEPTEQAVATPPPSPPDETPPVRALLAPSHPPPAPLPAPPAAKPQKAPPPPVPPPRAASPAAAPPPPAVEPFAILSELPIEASLEDLAPPPPPESTRGVVAVPPPPDSSLSGVAVPQAPESSGVAVQQAPESSRGGLAGPRGTEGKRNERLVAALKKIALLTRSGRGDEAYNEYAELYASEPFADYRPEDQRQALRMMVIPKTPPTTSSEAVIAAHRVAVRCLETLVSAQQEPADYELLGIAYTVIDDPPAASVAFQKGLERERERNPQSDLCGTLMRRLSGL